MFMLTLLCSVLYPAWDMEIILNPVNGIEYPVLVLKKEKEKGGFCPYAKIFKKDRKYIRCL